MNTESQVIGIGNKQRRPISVMTLLKRREPTHQMAPTYLPTSSLHLTTRESDQGESRKQMICVPVTNILRCVRREMIHPAPSGPLGVFVLSVTCVAGETGVMCVAHGETGMTCVAYGLAVNLE
jgi:hypothetical protein